MKDKSRFYDTWHLGYAYSESDIVWFENRFYRAQFQIPYYHDNPVNSEQREKKLKRSEKIYGCKN